MNQKKIAPLILLISALFFSCKQKIEDTIKPTDHKKPNIIFLFTDDQSFKDVQALGNPEVITPTFDKLVAEGTTFTHAYNMGGWNGAICVASRAMMISGRSIWRAQDISKNYSEHQDLDKTWPRLMQTAGYDTYMTGKWHVRAKADSIFNHVGHVLRGMPFDTPEGYNRPLSKNDTLWKPWKTEFGGYWKGGKHWSELVKDDAVSFIDSAATKEDPFFMYIAFNAPHDPRQSPKKYVDMYPLENISLPESFLPEYPYVETMLNGGKNLRDERLAPYPRTEYSVKVNRQEYYAITTHLDDQIKDILNALEQKGLKENTYIFLSSDHGLSVGEHGLLGKQSMYDHSMRVPLMIVGPSIPTGKKINSDVYIQDIMATALAIAGVEKPAYIDFNNLLAHFSENENGNYNGIYGTYEQKSQRMIRKDGFKLILYPKSQIVRLFDLKKDPLELNDISKDKVNDPKIKALFKDLLGLQDDMGDLLDLKAIYPNLN